MKKIKNIILSILALGTVGSVGVYAYAHANNKTVPELIENAGSWIKGKTEDVFVKKNKLSDLLKLDKNLFVPELESDDIENEDGLIQVAINEDAFNSYFASSTLTSKEELKGLYKDTYRTIMTQNTNYVYEYLDLYIRLENEQGKYVYLPVSIKYQYDKPQEYSYNYVPGIRSISEMTIKWQDGKTLIAQYKNGNIEYGTKAVNFNAESLKISAKSVAAVRMLYNGKSELKYFNCLGAYKVGNTELEDYIEYKDGVTSGIEDVVEFTASKYDNNDIQKLCNSLFTDLFTVRKRESETVNAVNKKMATSQALLKKVLSFDYDCDEAYGNHPVRNIYQLANTNLTSEETDSTEYGVLFQLNYLNEKTLDEIKLYLWCEFNHNTPAWNLHETEQLYSVELYIEDATGLRQLGQAYAISYDYETIDEQTFKYYTYETVKATASDYVIDLTDYRETEASSYFVGGINYRTIDGIKYIMSFDKKVDINEPDFPDDIIKACFEELEDEE